MFIYFPDYCRRFNLTAHKNVQFVTRKRTLNGYFVENYETAIQSFRILYMSCAPGYWINSFLEVNNINKTQCDLDHLWTAPIIECVKGKSYIGSQSPKILKHRKRARNSIFILISDKCSKFEFKNITATCKQNGTVINCSNNVVAGLEVTLPCVSDDGMQTATTAYSTVCQENGTWTMPTTDCIPITGTFAISNLTTYYITSQIKLSFSL